MTKRGRASTETAAQLGQDSAPPLINPFYRKWRRFKDLQHEMRLFRHIAVARIPEICETLPRFAELKSQLSFHVFDDVPTTIQASFGHRLMGRITLDNAVASENGASLVYSQGPTGDVVVILYPPQSQVARVHEKLILLRQQERSAARLLDGLQRDLLDLVAYSYVGSLDGDPTWRQSVRIHWLRFARRSQRDQDFTKPTTRRPISDIATAIPKMIATSVFGGVVKMVVPVVLMALLVLLGWTTLAGKLAPPSAPSPAPAANKAQSNR
jgi:hypothetical protein